MNQIVQLVVFNRISDLQDIPPLDAKEFNTQFQVVESLLDEFELKVKKDFSKVMKSPQLKEQGSKLIENVNNVSIADILIASEIRTLDLIDAFKFEDYPYIKGWTQSISDRITTWKKYDDEFAEFSKNIKNLISKNSERGEL